MYQTCNVHLDGVFEDMSHMPQTYDNSPHTTTGMCLPLTVYLYTRRQMMVTTHFLVIFLLSTNRNTCSLYTI
jgi:hypothetical protein